jgi:hypothetical protein
MASLNCIVSSAEGRVCDGFRVPYILGRSRSWDFNRGGPSGLEYREPIACSQERRVMVKRC